MANFNELIRSHGSSSKVVLGTGTKDVPADALAFVPVASSNLLTVSNASMGQATLLSIPDPGVASAVVDVSPSTAGNYTAVVTLTPAQVVTASTAGVALLPAPGAGNTIVVLNAILNTLSTGNTAYSSGGVPVIQYGATATGAGTSATAALTAAEVTAAANAVTQVAGASLAGATGISGLGIFLGVKTGNFAGGTGTNLVFTINYMILATGSN